MSTSSRRRTETTKAGTVRSTSEASAIPIDGQLVDPTATRGAATAGRATVAVADRAITTQQAAGHAVYLDECIYIVYTGYP